MPDDQFVMPALPPRQGPREAVQGVLAALGRHWRAMLLAFLLPCLLGIAAGLRAKPAYLAQARMLVLYAGDYVYHPGNHGTGNDIAFDRNQVIQAELQILQSPALLGKVAAAIGPDTLYPGISGSTPDPVRAAAERLGRELAISSVPQSNVIEMGLRSPSRETAINTLSALIEQYIPYRAGVFAKGQPTAEAVAEQAGFAARLQQAEDALSAFATEHGITNLDEQTNLAVRQRNDNATEQAAVAGSVAEVTARLAAVRGQLRTVPATVPLFAESTKSQQSSGLTDSLVRLQQQRRELVGRYRDDFPLVRDVDHQIAAVRGQIAASASREGGVSRAGRNTLYDELRTQEATLAAQLEGLQARQAALAAQAERIAARNAELVSVAQQHRELQRTRDVLDQSYRSIQRSNEESQLADALQRAAGANIRVVQPPDAPLVGRTMRLPLVAAGIAAGLLLAAAVAAVLNLLRPAAIGGNGVRNSLGLPMLATVPAQAGWQGGAATPPGPHR